MGTKTGLEIAEELEGIYMVDGVPTVRVTKRDVIKTQQDLIRREYGPQTDTQIFLEILESTPGIYRRVHRSENGRINAIFFSFEWPL